MFRRVSLALAIAAALAPLNVQSLGLGEIQSKSYLNQTLDADIQLLSVDPDELDGIKVKLASVEEFKRAGIDRPFVLNSLRFKPVRLPNGKMVIRASSGDPIREPFLNFLVEVNWPKGRLLREYTVLLDPPVTLPRRPRPVTAPVLSPAVAATPRNEAPRQAAVASAASAGEYGPIQPNATLWSIAKGLQVEGATVEQVMMALLDQNPDAFINGNINLLKAGEVLRIPAEQSAQERSRQQAREEFLQQLADWQPALKAEEPAVAAVSGEPTAELAAPPEPASDVSPAGKETIQEAQLKLTSRTEEDPNTDPRGVGLGAGAYNQVLEQELLLAREESAVARRESEELRARVDDLESQVDDLQRLLSLQSDELARMQQAATVESDGLEDMVAQAGPDEAMELSDGEEMAGGEAVPPMLAGDGWQPEAPETAAQPEPESAALPEPESEAEPEPESVAQPAPEPSLVDRVMSGDSMLIGGLGAVGALVLAVVGFVVRRRREDSLEDEFLDEESVAGAASRAAAVNSTRPTVMQAQEAGLDENPFGGFAGAGATGGHAAAEQLDALSEVDVYIAYGRYEEAEDLLKREIESQPERLDLKHRLLDIYSSTGNKVAFVSLFEQMSRSGAAEQDPESWSEVLRKGGELAPNNPLFGAAGAATVAAVAPLSQEGRESASSGLEFDLDLDALEAEDLQPAAQTGTPTDLEAELGRAPGQDSQPEAEAGGGFDFDLDLEALAGAEAPQPESSDRDNPLDADLDLEKLFSFDSDEGKGEDAGERMVQASDFQSQERQQSSASAQDETGDLGLSEVEFQAEEEESLSLDEVAGAFMPEPDLAAVQTPEEPEELSLEGLLDDGEKSEVETMLDLAQIYVDMGDPDDARDILEEALKEGDEGQQQRAREIMQSLS